MAVSLKRRLCFLAWAEMKTWEQGKDKNRRPLTNSLAGLVACGRMGQERIRAYFFSLDSAPHTTIPRAGQHLANKTMRNAETVKYLKLLDLGVVACTTPPAMAVLAV